MCTRYIPPDVAEIEREWHIGRGNQPDWARDMHPLYAGPFIRRTADASLALVVGQWGMIPPDSETRIPMSKPRGPGEKPKRISTVNARSESVNSRPTFSSAWREGRRCIIPAESFFEPNWESGKNVWWRFRRADGRPWGIAGIWSNWTDPETGELVPNYTMLTLNADAHPLMKRMHKPDPKVAPDRQDKRSLVLLEAQDFDTWLDGSVEQAKALVQLTPVDFFNAEPEVKTPQAGLL